MSELRKDPVMGRWIIIAAERAKRPQDFHSDKPHALNPKNCPFCEGNESKTPPEIIAYRNRGTRPNEPGWWVRVIPNLFPALSIEGDLDKRGAGMYDTMRGIGAHEVIVESPHHVTSLTDIPEERVREVVWTYRDRLVDLKKDHRFVYGLIFKNVGKRAGASLEHTHSQLIVTPTIPYTPIREMQGASDFYGFRGRCLFCDMIQQELASNERVILNTADFIAITPFASRFPFETWILPKEHSSHFENLHKYEVEGLASILQRTLKKIERALLRPPYNYIIHTAPFDLGEIDYYHWHIEIIPRITRVAGFEWGTDFYINPVVPEEAAQCLREIDESEPQADACDLAPR
jgi:UDPglucose--hexose-1-phosphate uridylyltransferase